MKNALITCFLAIGLAMLSCKKEVASDSERLWEQLQNVIKTQQVERIVPTTLSSLDPANTILIGDYGSVYSFEAPMLYVGSSSYNLNALVTYEIMTISTYKCLVLYFRH